jgi:hypothetical protein
MKKIILLSLISIFFSMNMYAVEKKKCSELEGFKKLGKKTGEYLNCLKTNAKGESKLKFKTESKLTDLITGKEKIKLPNPMNVLKNVGKAVKPDLKLKK